MATKKYRPYFTLAELKTLRGFCASVAQTERLHKYIDKYILDIEHAHRKPNHTLLPSISEKLGFSSSGEGESIIPSTPEEAAQLQRDHDANRYANNQMSPQEERDYEYKMFGVSTRGSDEPSADSDTNL